MVRHGLGALGTVRGQGSLAFRETNTPVALVPEVQKGLEPARLMVYDQLPADSRRMVRFHPDYWMPGA